MVCPEKWTLGRLKSGSRLEVECTKTFLQVLELVVVAAIIVVANSSICSKSKHSSSGQFDLVLLAPDGLSLEEVHEEQGT